jgi:hypothetical protein
MRRGAINITLLATIVVIIGLGLIIGVMYMNYSNTEVGLRNRIEAKQKDNTSRFDNMWKEINQVAQVTEGQKNALREIFEGYAKARSGSGDGGSLAKWIHESVPNVDTSTFNNLQNIITGSRDRWTEEQAKLIDLNLQHDNCLMQAPSSWFVGSRPRIEIKIVTSSRTEAAFDAGKDDDVNVFPRKAEK